MTTVFTSDIDIAAALTELLTDTTNLLTSAQAQRPIDKDEVAFWKRQVNALNKADFHWTSGVRPVRSGDTWLIPSASRGGSLVHRLARHGGVLVCGCEAGQKQILCWHHMLINVIERALELAALAMQAAEPDESDDGVVEIDDQVLIDDERAASAALGRRLCAARSRYDYAA